MRKKKIFKLFMKKKRTWKWRKFLLGLKRPAIALIAALLAWIAGFEQWSWIAGIGAERIWATFEYYLKK